MKKYLLYLLLTTSIVGCGTSKLDSKEIEELQSLLETKSFEFKADRVNPMATQSLNAISNSGLLPPGSNAGSIQLNGGNNFLKIMGDSVSANLPYYGERRFGGGYGSDAGIEFNGIPTHYSQIYNKDRKRYDITMQLDQKMESYNLNLSIFPNKIANLTISSNQRNTIRYSGNVLSIKVSD
ncbi:DUF4251 domain-containing protein [Maribacter sp. X9]|uniref:DUF4251 domain-containing protein n=1 Tax=Maribacter sp. X9 TaxID=3402159 RepID=UPI003AF354C4